jgi:hypothetical protein
MLRRLPEQDVAEESLRAHTLQRFQHVEAQLSLRSLAEQAPPPVTRTPLQLHQRKSARLLPFLVLQVALPPAPLDHAEEAELLASRVHHLQPRGAGDLGGHHSQGSLDQGFLHQALRRLRQLCGACGSLGD